MMEGSVKEIKAKLGKLSDDQLRQLEKDEREGDNRSTLIAAIENEWEDRSEKVETGPSIDEKAEAPVNSEIKVSEHILFEQGRTAGMGGISKEDAPHDPRTPEYAEWLKGWNFARG